MRLNDCEILVMIDCVDGEISATRHRNGRLFKVRSFLCFYAKQVAFDLKQVAQMDWLRLNNFSAKIIRGMCLRLGQRL